MKNALTHIVNYEKTIFDKKNYLEKCDMTSVNLGKALEYLKISYFYMFFSTLKDIIQTQSKAND